MDWRLLTLREKVLGTITAVAIIVAGALYLWTLHGPNYAQTLNWGFGPEWDCVFVGPKAGPICIKKPPAK
jgi:hypothetical protein